MTEHTLKFYGEELDQLKAEVARLGGLAEAQLGDAIDATANRDVGLAQSVIVRDQVRPQGAKARMASSGHAAMSRMGKAGKLRRRAFCQARVVRRVQGSCEWREVVKGALGCVNGGLDHVTVPGSAGSA